MSESGDEWPAGAPEDELPETEGVNPRTLGLDALDTPALVALLGDEHVRAARAVADRSHEIAVAVDAIVARLRAGGTLHYFGAGTSGRLAMLDAAECPPTFGTPPSLVRAHVAGGAEALTAAIEGAEDDFERGALEARDAVAPGDAVVGISASGGARYVLGAVRAARARGTLTIGVVSSAQSPLVRASDLGIVVASGAEPIAGSTRLKAGTAQKLVLNALSTATMVRLGKVYDNRMIDVLATNDKLRLRARRLVEELGPVGPERALALLEAADGSAKVAVAMSRCHVGAAEARALLARHDGSLRALIG